MRCDILLGLLFCWGSALPVWKWTWTWERDFRLPKADMGSRVPFVWYF